MKPVLHVYEPGASTELNTYLDRRRCDLAVSFDEAPKLAHSIAIELDDALDCAMLIDGDTIMLPVILSDVEDMEVDQACLSAFEAHRRAPAPRLRPGPTWASAATASDTPA